jgi:hypothetical protein
MADWRARREGQALNIWGWLIVLGAVAASVGLTIYGMGTSTLQPSMWIIDIGKVLMLVGLLALVVGFVAYKATERSGSA